MIQRDQINTYRRDCRIRSHLREQIMIVCTGSIAWVLLMVLISRGGLLPNSQFPSIAFGVPFGSLAVHGWCAVMVKARAGVERKGDIVLAVCMTVLALQITGALRWIG